MNSSEWQSAVNPGAMLEFAGFRTSERKLRLCGCAFLRRVSAHLPHPRSMEAIELAERFADGMDTMQALHTLYADVEAARTGILDETYVFLSILSESAERGAQELGGNTASLGIRGLRPARFASALDAARVEIASIVRDIIRFRDLTAKNPFAKIEVDTWLTSWNGGTVVRLAQSIYEDRVLPSGHFRADRLLILADALEEAGCADEAILSHCRGPGPHVRGCWVVDLVLGKD